MPRNPYTNTHSAEELSKSLKMALFQAGTTRNKMGEPTGLSTPTIFQRFEQPGFFRLHELSAIVGQLPNEQRLQITDAVTLYLLQGEGR